jgi:hypothetical protein
MVSGVQIILESRGVVGDSDCPFGERAVNRSLQREVYRDFTSCYHKLQQPHTSTFTYTYTGSHLNETLTC